MLRTENDYTVLVALAKDAAMFLVAGSEVVLMLHCALAFSAEGFVPTAFSRP